MWRRVLDLRRRRSREVHDSYRYAIGERSKFVDDETPDPWAKFLWAWHRMDSLYGDVRRWVDEGNIWVETSIGARRGDEVRTDHRLRFNSIPADWAPRVGEVFQHYRSSLDHMVFALSTAVKGEPLTEAEAVACEFPIVEPSRTLSKSVEERRLRWLPKDARDYIREQQPHFGGQERDLLWLVHRLANIDKHRSLNVTGTGVLDAGDSLPEDIYDGEVVLIAPGLDGKPCAEGCRPFASVNVGDGLAVKSIPIIRGMCQIHVRVEEVLQDVINLTVPNEFGSSGVELD